MIYFIGLGLNGVNGVPKRGLDLTKNADIVYLDVYTSPIAQDEINSLQSMINKKIVTVERNFIENGYEIINQAKEKDVVLMVPGDPMVATTHMDLRLRAEKSGIKTQVVHSSSIISALPGETGLHIYSFGKSVTLMRSGWTPISTVYEVVYENLLKGLHTVILLEYDRSIDFFLKPEDALQSLQTIEKDYEKGIFSHDTFIIVASRVGSQSQSLSGGKLGALIHQDYGDPPHVLLVPGKLHFTEVDALKTLLKIDGDSISDNSSRAPRLAVSMVTRYARSTMKALSKAREKGKAKGKKHLDDLFENVECYILDAERFLNMGKYELAILSTGYAEGLLDSLRFTKELEIEW